MMDKFLSQVIVRHLPPTMTQKQFLEQISPAPEHNYFHYSKADLSLGQFSFCRACINFVNQKDIFVFKDKFDGYVFVDQKGNEYPAIVEFSPFQKIPKKIGSNGQPISAKKRDPKSGTIEEDPDYKNFLQVLKDSKNDANLPSAEINLEEIEARDRELKANHGVTKVTTPLIEFIKERKAEKNRLREERREERKRQQDKKLREEEHHKKEKDRNESYKLKKRDRKEKTKERKDKNQSEKNKDKFDNEKSNKIEPKKYFKNKTEKVVKKDNNEPPTFTVRVLQNVSKEKPKDSSKSDSLVKTNVEKQETTQRNDKSIKDGLSSSKSKDQKLMDQESKDYDTKSEIKRVRNKDRPAMEIYRPGMRRALNQSSSKIKDHEVNKKLDSNLRGSKVYTRSRNTD